MEAVVIVTVSTTVLVERLSHPSSQFKTKDIRAAGSWAKFAVQRDTKVASINLKITKEHLSEVIVNIEVEAFNIVAKAADIVVEAASITVEEAIDTTTKGAISNELQAFGIIAKVVRIVLVEFLKAATSNHIVAEVGTIVVAFSMVVEVLLAVACQGTLTTLVVVASWAIAVKVVGTKVFHQQEVD